MSTAIDHLAGAIASHAVALQRPSGAFLAYVPQIAHVACADGETRHHALARLHAEIVRNLPRVLEAWAVLGPRNDLDLAEPEPVAITPAGRLE